MNQKKKVKKSKSVTCKKLLGVYQTAKTINEQFANIDIYKHWGLDQEKLSSDEKDFFDRTNKKLKEQ